jgi:hypothetical protein
MIVPQFLAQHLSIEENQCVDRLMLAGGAELPLEHEVVEECLDLRPAQLPRGAPCPVRPAREGEELANPALVAIDRPRREVPPCRRRPKSFEQFHGEDDT